MPTIRVWYAAGQLFVTRFSRYVKAPKAKSQYTGASSQSRGCASSGGPRAPRHPSSCRRCTSSGQGQSRDERARCATSRSSETGSGHESSGSAWIVTGRCECARCVTWGSNLPDGDPRILGGRDPESRIFFLVGLIFFFFGARLRFFLEFSKILGKGNRWRTRYDRSDRARRLSSCARVDLRCKSMPAQDYSELNAY